MADNAVFHKPPQANDPGISSARSQKEHHDACQSIWWMPSFEGTCQSCMLFVPSFFISRQLYWIYCLAQVVLFYLVLHFFLFLLLFCWFLGEGRGCPKQQKEDKFEKPACVLVVCNWHRSVEQIVVQCTNAIPSGLLMLLINRYLFCLLYDKILFISFEYTDTDNGKPWRHRWHVDYKFSLFDFCS